MKSPSSSSSVSSLASLLRTLSSSVLGVLLRDGADFAAAEDAVQEALLAASTTWPTAGLPDSPRAWLITVARRRLIDAVRTEGARRRRENEQLDARLVSGNNDIEVDDSLRLLFMCCHPSLSSSSAVALTLRAVGGLSTAEIARAFFVPEATMAQRISRAKQTISSSSLALTAPVDRTANVLQVLHLIFSEGYAASAGATLVRSDLVAEAIRLCRLLLSALPDDAEVAGLLALMILTDARRAARTDVDGGLVPLDKQDRTRWDHVAIAEGVALISATLSRGHVGPFQLQAAIAAAHDEAVTAADTDWLDILGLYGVWMRLSDNPMVALNHAVALAMVQGPRAGLARVDVVANDPRLVGHHRVEAVRGHLLLRAGDREQAAVHFLRAAHATTSTVERDYLLQQAAALTTT